MGWKWLPVISTFRQNILIESSYKPHRFFGVCLAMFVKSFQINFGLVSKSNQICKFSFLCVSFMPLSMEAPKLCMW